MIRQLLHRLNVFSAALPRKRPGRVKAFVARFRRRPLNTWGLVYLALIAGAALLADVLASSVPIAYSVDNEIRVLPGLFNPDGALAMDNAAVIEAVKERGGWALIPPVPYGPNQTKVAGKVRWLAPPDEKHLLGTDDKGRDVLARIIHGSRSALFVGLGSVALYLLVAIVLGSVAGYLGGLADKVALRLIETLTSFPSFFLILALQGLLGATSLWQLVLIIGLTRWTDVAKPSRPPAPRSSPPSPTRPTRRRWSTPSKVTAPATATTPTPPTSSAPSSAVYRREISRRRSDDHLGDILL